MLPHTLLLVIGVNSLALSMLCGVAPLWQPKPSTCQASDAGGMNSLRWFSSKVWTCVCQAPRGHQAGEPWLKISSGFWPRGDCISAVYLSGQGIWWGILGEKLWDILGEKLPESRSTAESAARSEEPGGEGGLLPCWAWEWGGSACGPHLQQCRLLFFTPCYLFLRCK